MRIESGQIELVRRPPRVTFPQRHTLTSRDRRVRWTSHGDRFARSDGATHCQPGHPEIAECDVLGEVVTVRQCQLLVGSLERRHVVVLELQGCRVLRELGGEVPLRQIETGGDTHVPTESRLRVAVEVEAALAPGAGNDERLDEVTLYAVEVGGLV